jgi:hypothetical protein
MPLMKIENYYLDLEKVLRLVDKDERDQIHSYYKDMLYSIQDGRKEMGISIMNTLIKSGYLIDSRDEKLGELLDGN